MDHFAALSCFVRVAESGSFSEAARGLGRSQSAISQQLRILETHLGVRLIDRTTRRFALTDAGARYLADVKLVLEALTEADARVAEQESAMSGKLMINAPVNFGTSLLGGFLFEFMQTYPKIQLDVSLSDRFVDIVAEGFDLAIRLGAVDEPNIIARNVGTIERCLAATPAYLDNTGRPASPAELGQMNYIAHAAIPGGGTFALTHTDGTKQTVKVEPVLRSDNSHMVSEAISAGRGVGLVHAVLLKPMVESGVLERVLPEWHYEAQSVHAIYPSNRYIPRRVRVFVEAFASHLQKLGQDG
ncbi:LysR family transcriptional regulator [Bradyrhizobium iriomotense]|uniref:LysR family transcriptional regulator n=1 Tax=Bradyrhizobium iriomotense TaxID=441950 RepID=A0ABQ6BC86_9BRAD|nr:LysR family transcriptional regulator [Bradyrhizobium iriomotense]GLR90550.1 LysR family transcriptional regulator [Bradyrhizobium iriomotense]